MPWNPGADPFPDKETEAITDFEYLDELHFARHAKAPPETSDSLWQLAKRFRARMTVHFTDGGSKSLTLTAPRGLYTDLASVPKLAWSIIGPVGRHLEASILHDYLFMAWTDFRDTARRQDFAFANEMFNAGLKASSVSYIDRNLILLAVETDYAWRVFAKKPYTLKARMDSWLPHLAGGHGRVDHELVA